MGNKREFKKYITTVSSSIVQDMMEAYYNIEGVNKEEINKAVIEVLKAGECAIMHCNVKYDKSPKAFELKREYTKAKAAFFKTLYRKVNQEFAKSINEAVAKFNAAVPADVKASQKD